MFVPALLLTSWLLQPGAADPVAADRKALLGEWDYPPVVLKGGAEVSVRLRFGADGSGSLALRRGAETDRKPFSYAVAVVGEERVVVVKGEAFPDGAVLVYKGLTDKVLFFTSARLPSAWLAGDPAEPVVNRANVAGGWFRPELKVR
jgi:hypothetical protein